jgi:hypothetical protein
VCDKWKAAEACAKKLEVALTAAKKRTNLRPKEGESNVKKKRKWQRIDAFIDTFA